MPIEIKELHIRVTINTPPAGGATPSPSTSAPANGGGVDKEALLAECVEQVVQILQQKRER